MPQQFIDRMAVHVDGEGDALVMVHGLGGTSNAWTPLLPALARYRVVRPELPGSGRSHKAHALDQGALTIDRLVSSVLRVCGALGIERAWFAGHSLGTIVCQHLAAREPRVRLRPARPASPIRARSSRRIPSSSAGLLRTTATSTTSTSSAS